MDQQLICSWYEQYKNGIFRYALSLTKDPCLAEDVLQDTFVKLISTNIPFAPGKEQAWLYRVARNLCYDHLRKLKREQQQNTTASAADGSYQFIDMITSLSPKDQQIVTLKIVGGLTHQEIGAVLGITSKAAQKRYQRAIAQLQQKEETNGAKTT